MKGVRRARDLFVCFGAKPNKGLSSKSRRDQKLARERQGRSWKKELREGSWRRVTQRGFDNRQQKWPLDRVQEQWGKTSQYESAFLVALWKFREGCTSALVYRCIGNAVSRNHPFCTWVDLSPYCSFVLCSFSPTPSVVFLVAIKKCVIPLMEPLDDLPAKTELFKRRGIITTACIRVSSFFCFFKIFG